MIKIDKIDKKIIRCLDINSRSSNSKIAKEIGQSKFIIKSRIERLEEKGVIKEYITYIDINRLGYNFYDVFVKTKSIKPKDYDIIINRLKEISAIGWLVTSFGEWNMIICIISKNPKELAEIMEKIESILGIYLIKYDMFIVTKAHQLPYRFLLDERLKESLPTSLGFDNLPNLQEQDIKIINIISNDARISYTNLALRSKMSLDIVRYRLNKLINMKVIQGFKPLIDVSKLGIIWHIVLFKLSFLDKKSIYKLDLFFKNLKEVFYIVYGVGNWNMMVEFHNYSYEDFNNVYSIVKRKVKDFVISESALQVSKEIKCSFVPDLR